MNTVTNVHFYMLFSVQSCSYCHILFLILSIYSEKETRSANIISHEIIKKYLEVRLLHLYLVYCTHTMVFVELKLNSQESENERSCYFSRLSSR